MKLKRVLIDKKSGYRVLIDDETESICGYNFQFPTPVDFLTIIHNKNSDSIVVQIFDSNNEVIKSESLKVELNSFTINFSQELSGYVNFIIYTNESDECLPL